MTAEDASMQPLTQQLLDAVDRGDVALPPLPEFAGRVVRLLDESSEASATAIAEVIQNEPAVAATVLKISNSAMFGGLKTITSLSQAVARLGIKQVSSVVTTLIHKGNFRSDDEGRMALLQSQWHHAVATAVTARKLSAVTLSDPEEAFLAGLLHDVGKLLVLKGVDYLNTERDSPPVTRALIEELMQTLHAELGHRALKAWHLPETMCRVALHHHDEDPDADDALMSCIQGANVIAHRMAASDTQVDASLTDAVPIERLNLSEIELAELLVDLEDQLDELKNLF